MAKWFAVIILAATLIFTQVAQKSAAESAQDSYKQMLPAAASFKSIDDKVVKALDKEGNLLAYIGLDQNIGYGGPVLVGTLIAVDGSINNIVVLHHNETPSYIKDMEDAGYFKQYLNKSVAQRLELDQDIDRVSGATLSSRAIAKSVQSVAKVVATKELKIASNGTTVTLKVGLPEMAIAFLFVAGLFLARRPRLAKYRLLLLGLSAISMGFWLNRPLTIAHIAGLFQGYFPDINTNLIWYIVVIGAVLPALIMGKNVYCTYICPFCALQETTHLISRKNLPIGENMIVLRRFKDFILFIVLFLAFLLQNPSIPSFEPFGTAFGLTGSGVFWYLLAVVLLASFFFRRFWCIAFCPVGTFLDKTAAVGRSIRKKVRTVSLQKQKACNTAQLEETLETLQDLGDDDNKIIQEHEKRPTELRKQNKDWSGRLLVVFYIAIVIGILLVVFNKWWVMSP